MFATTRSGLAVLAVLVACEGGPPAATRPAAAAVAAPPITARGVELRLPRPGGGDVVIRGDAFALGADRSATLEGDVRLASEGRPELEASAARASIADGGRIAVLEGGVRAVLAIDGPGDDAGGADD